MRSEEHTSELQSQSNLVCRLLLEKKKIKTLKALSPSIAATGNGQCKGVLLIVDLTATSTTSRRVRQMLPCAHCPTCCCKPARRPPHYTSQVKASRIGNRL